MKDDPDCKCIFELMDAVDSYIPMPERASDKPFLMPVEDVFSITGRGTVATGRVERGTVKVQDTVEIVGLTDQKRSVVVTGVEMFRKLLGPGDRGRQHRRTAAWRAKERDRARPGAGETEQHHSRTRTFRAAYTC